MVISRQTYAVEVTASSRADAATIFALVADGARWSEWAGPVIAHSSLERLGDPAPGGVGGVRLLGRKPVLVREETLEYEQDRRHVYALRTPSPMKDYQGEITLTPREDGGTEVVWRASFTELVPGTGPILRFGLNKGIKMLSRKLISAAQR
ncbi:Polyketide cyclase / dehydrase and lipid transport [Actinokineospora alba]|uniref:Polyketide cyclase / dehydrase and lipid transport n=1 Tax=Actinokineospora alba TaxID=504798 RepID=A0A1H0T686_9PSEU|nr:SRPBCC family protein [Actinokineospora alba]TDP66354.1 polyketide cyclase/dehydrase/lipid transport protein [Actinokineospora alba]SDJ22741.1 Polyketide cyclase / dehydrase and lipid transport [Actinokineospora alba]SDP49365.1 Polyketide cyclase / dehydrase and lipid transport [Actinokineospora alba]